MLLLILGLLMWSVVHFIPAVAISGREQLIRRWGEIPYKMVIAVLLLSSVLMMVLGWRAIHPVPVYAPPAWGALATALLMPVTFVLFAAAQFKSNIKRLVRHPQLSALVVWSIAHLLSNGDMRSLLLFSALGMWALAEMLLINRRDGTWVKPEPVSFKFELLTLITGLVGFIVFIFAHSYLFGVSPLAF